MVSYEEQKQSIMKHFEEDWEEYKKETRPLAKKVLLSNLRIDVKTLQQLDEELEKDQQ